MKVKVQSTVLLFLTAIIWGFAFVAQRVGADYVGTFTFNGIRFLLGSFSLIPVILIFEREAADKKKLLKTFYISLAAGTVLFIAASLQQYGVELTGSAGKAGFLTGLYTVLVPVFRFFLGKKTSVLTFIGAFFAVGGLFFLCMTGNSVSFGKGDIVLIIGAVFWAFHILIIDKFVNDVSPLKFSMMQFFVCGVLSVIGALLTETVEISSVKAAAVPILYGGIMSVGVAYTCQILGQKHSDPTFASIVFSTESVFSAVGGALLLNEIMTCRGYFGCALIFVGIVLSQINLQQIKEKFNKKQQY